MSEPRDEFILLGRDDVSDFNEANVLPESAESIAQIQEWLEPTAYHAEGSEYRKHLSSHVVGTGDWLKSTDAYRQWHDGSNTGPLWIKGIPGSGKSVIAASLANELARESCPVLFFFFRQIVAANHEPRSLLRDWLSQILGYSPPLQRILKEHRKNDRSISNISTDDLWRYISLALADIPKAYCIADALDEMDSNNDLFLQKLAEFGNWRPAKIKVLISSRPVPSVEGPLRRISMRHIRLEEKQVDRDIAFYVNHRLQNHSIGIEERESINRAVPGRANGLFLYAKLAIDSLVEPGANISEVLERLPLDLNVMYTDLLNEHSRRSQVARDLQLFILQWVTHSRRPLRLLEMAEVVNVTYFKRGSSSLKATKDLVRVACGPLLEILPDETVSPIHHSLTEFLTDIETSPSPIYNATDTFPVLQFAETHERLALSCVEYLLSGSLDKWTVKNRSSEHDFYNPEVDEKNALRIQHPFVVYAAENWYRHAALSLNAGIDPTQLHSLLDQFLLPDTHAFKAWQDMEFSVSSFTALHAAARTGIVSYTRYLLEHDESTVDAFDSSGRPAITWAASEGHVEVVKLLLAHSAEPDLDDNLGLKPLHAAAQNNRASVVRILLEKGVNPLTTKTKETGRRRCGNAPTTVGHTPLMYACQAGHVEAVAAFLPFLNELTIVHQSLAWAAAAAQAKVVAEILKHPGVEPDATTQKFGDSALFHACKVRDLNTIRILLEAGANPNLPCKWSPDPFGGMQAGRFFDVDPSHDRGYTPMHAFASTDSYLLRARDAESVEEALKALLEAGGEINRPCRDGKLPLHYACASHSGPALGASLVRLLLGAGSDANEPNADGEIPLHLCLNNQDIMDMLLESGKADINRPRSSDGCTPLLVLLSNHVVENTLHFLRYSPDCNATNSNGDGPFHYAVKQWNTSVQVLEALLEAGARVNLRNNSGEEPLHVIQDNRDFIPLLLKAGADLEAKDNQGRSVLFRAISAHHREWESMINLLVESGADVHTRDHTGRTILHEAVRCRLDLAKLDMLVSLGVDALLADNAGNTLLHENALLDNVSFESEKHVARFKKFLALGVPIDASNCQGRTPLHVISGISMGTSAAAQELSFDFILAASKTAHSVDTFDIHGIRAIHIAATFSEDYVAKLIDAGADIASTSKEGLTPLHLATRARQPNVVGQLLAAYGSTLPSNDELKINIEKRDKAGRTALQYACRSGCPETVALLLAAGAAPSAKDTLDMCVTLSDAQLLWGGAQDSGSQPFHNTRPQHTRHGNDDCFRLGNYQRFVVNTENDTTRLGEIVDLLVSYGADVHAEDKYGTSILRLAIRKASNTDCKHAVDCLSALEAAKFDSEGEKEAPRKRGWTELFVEYERDAFGRALQDSGILEDRRGHARLLEQLLKMRRFSAIEKLAQLGADFLQPSSLELLVKWGYTDLLAKLHRYVATKHEIKTWSTAQQCQETMKPLIITACEREMPNLDMLKFLVEVMKVDINAQHYKRTYRQGFKMVTDESALHTVATGRHWWQVAQALPYLISKGIELDAKDENGATALHNAVTTNDYIRGSHVGYWHRRAAEILIDAGANVNAVDDAGNSVLAKAGSDLMLELLISKGAKVTAPAIFSALDSGNVDVLKLLLSSGVDPNARREAKKESVSKESLHRSWTLPEDHEFYPLHYAAITHQRNRARRQGVNSDERMVEVLLEYGANPYLTFLLPNKGSSQPSTSYKDAFGSDSPASAGDGQKSRQKGVTLREGHTIIHHILRNDAIHRPFIQLPSLKLEHRDRDGATLLLAACQNVARPANTQTNLFECKSEETSNEPSLAEYLVCRGANALAVDHEGKSALHILGDKSRVSQSLTKFFIDKAPELVRSLDNSGTSPLHLALQHWDSQVIKALLAAGADPLQRDPEGRSALHFALPALQSEGGNGFLEAEQLFRHFLKSGIDINSRDEKGNTPLFAYIAAYSGRNLTGYPEQKWETQLGMLMNEGADVFIRNESGENLLHLVARKKEPTSHFRFYEGCDKHCIPEQFEHLLALGLDPMQEDSHQRSAIDVASAYGNDGILKLFERKG